MFRSIQFPLSRREMPTRVPAPSHRHGTPSGPWPFLDLDTEVDRQRLEDPVPLSASPPCDHSDPSKCQGCWSRYPQSLFPNWTRAQQKKSRIARVIDHTPGNDCLIYYVNVMQDGIFTGSGNHVVRADMEDSFWETTMLEKRPDGTRVRALFVENLSGPVLQMLGTKYNVEPFFFSSSLGWIPSRYEEEVRPAKGDHITITLTFIRTMTNPTTAPPSPSSSYTASTTTKNASDADQVIDTLAPLMLRSSDRILFSDLLSLHMVRTSSSTGSTIISYHAGIEHRSTTAKSLYERFRSAGQSVYWNKIMSTAADPTFALLTIVWYALYAWDEALEALYAHICWLETHVMATNDMRLTHTQELHVIRAHLLHYSSLLEDLRKSVVFVMSTPYPALDDPDLFSPGERGKSQDLMNKECGNLLSEINRLEESRKMQEKRLKNVMNLGFSSVNIEDSRRMQRLTEAAVRDSAAMKQIAYLTMIFLPASFVATAFGMNIDEINPGSSGTLRQYFATAVPLTVVTIWVIVAYQIQNSTLMKREPTINIGMIMGTESSEGGGWGGDDGDRKNSERVLSIWSRFGWPVWLVIGFFERRIRRRRVGSGL